MLIYERKVELDPGRFFACFCGAAIGIGLTASPTFLEVPERRCDLGGDVDQGTQHLVRSLHDTSASLGFVLTNTHLDHVLGNVAVSYTHLTLPTTPYV